MVCVCVWVCVCVCVYVCVPGVLIIQIFMHVNIWVYTMCSLISCANILLCTQQHVNISDENLDADITDENLHPNIWVSSLSPFTIRRVFHLDFKNYLFFSKVSSLGFWTFWNFWKRYRKRCNVRSTFLKLWRRIIGQRTVPRTKTI